VERYASLPKRRILAVGLPGVDRPSDVDAITARWARELDNILSIDLRQRESHWYTLQHPSTEAPYPIRYAGVKSEWEKDVSRAVGLPVFPDSREKFQIAPFDSQPFHSMAENYGYEDDQYVRINVHVHFMADHLYPGTGSTIGEELFKDANRVGRAYRIRSQGSEDIREALVEREEVPWGYSEQLARSTWQRLFDKFARDWRMLEITDDVRVAYITRDPSSSDQDPRNIFETPRNGSYYPFPVYVGLACFQVIIGQMEE